MQKNKNYNENNSELDCESLKGDYSNVALLVLLYSMQGVILGVGYALPIILLNKGYSYSDQAIFSFAFYPSTVKVLWAPFVDSIYIKCCGRRKSWLVSSQLLIGFFFIFLSQKIDLWMNDDDDNLSMKTKPKIEILTMNFVILFFLAATQDIVIDGWAVNMLKTTNRGYAGFCNQIGQVIGFTISYTSLLMLESKDFCNQFFFHIQRNQGVITHSTFFSICGCGFIFTTLMIAFFKSEEDKDESQKRREITQTYTSLWRILKLRNVMKFSLIIITVKFCVAACNGITDLKIVERGVSKEIFALLSFSKTLAKLLIPIVMRKSTSGDRPLSVFMKVFPYRMLMISMMTIFIHFIPNLIRDGITDIFCLSLAILLFLTEISPALMSVAEMSFYAKISDPIMSATYMTLLVTISNLGHSWIKTFYLYLMDLLTWKSCTSSDRNSTCVTLFDGYYVEIIFGVIFSFVWYFCARETVEELQNLPQHSWHVTTIMQKCDDNVDDEVKNEELKVLNKV